MPARRLMTVEWRQGDKVIQRRRYQEFEYPADEPALSVPYPTTTRNGPFMRGHYKTFEIARFLERFILLLVGGIVGAVTTALVVMDFLARGHC